MNQVKNVLLIQVFHSFASGIIGIAVPLMMKARNVDVVMMGLVFAALPLIMQFTRIFFATISDFLGRKPFFIANGFLATVSSLIYYVAHTPLEFLFGKVVEGTKEGALWAVNRPFLLEKTDGHWRILVFLRTVVYIAYAAGSLLAGFFIVWLLFDGTMLLCALFGLLAIAFAFLLSGDKKQQFKMTEALKFLDFRKKGRVFKISLVLFFAIGLSGGFRGGFVLPVFLSDKGFNDEMVGLIIGFQILIAGLFSYLFSRSSKMRTLILLSGILYTLTFLFLGFLGAVAAGILVTAYGFVEGMNSIGQEGILTKICTKESYGIDISLLMTGLHIGETLSLALSGVLISLWGFAVPFILSASTYTIFYLGSFLLFKE
ncbi:MAG TPA: MFS transporter [Candidatus Acidoferrum sp.]|nr:MFS transporter [Candidatus Acidoferrum sp.]